MNGTGRLTRRLIQQYGERVPYRPPAAWYRRTSNRLGVLLTSLGLAPQGAVTLQVRGRRSGRIRRVPVLVVEHLGQEYLLSLAGESDWVRNVRAAGGRAVLRRRTARPVRLLEVPVAGRPPVVAAYLRRPAGRAGTAELRARTYFGLPPDPSPADLRAAAAWYPVFRIVPAGSVPAPLAAGPLCAEPPAAGI